MLKNRDVALTHYLQTNASVYVQTAKTYVAKAGILKDKLARYPYYSPKLTSATLRTTLATLSNPMRAISAANPLGQNGFHYVLATTNFSPGMWQGYACVVFEEKEIGKFLSEQREEQSWHAYKRSNPTGAAQRLYNHTESLLKELLSAFPNNTDGNAKLFAALSLQETEEENTVLHRALKSHSAQVYPHFNARIAHFSPEHKLELATARDSSRKTALHYVARNCSAELFSQTQAAFGEVAMRAALNCLSTENNTLLHEACSSAQHMGVDRHYKIMSICTLLSTPPAPLPESKAVLDEAALPLTLTQAFRKNAKGMNPLHLVCQSVTRDEKNDGEAVFVLCRTLGGGLSEKVMELDDFGRTPLHHAAESGSGIMARALLAGLTATERERLVLAKNKKGETVLHIALKNGDLEIFQAIIDSISPIPLYELHISADIQRLVANSAIKINYQTYIEKHLSAFLYVRYFVDNAPRHKSKDLVFQRQLKDAEACALAKVRKEEFPEEDKSFLEKSQQTFHKRRQAFRESATLEEFSTTMNYLIYDRELPSDDKRMLTGLFLSAKTEAAAKLKASEEKKVENVHPVTSHKETEIVDVVKPSATAFYHVFDPLLPPPEYQEPLPVQQYEPYVPVDIAPIHFVPVTDAPGESTLTVVSARPEPSAPPPSPGRLTSGRVSDFTFIGEATRKQQTAEPPPTPVAPSRAPSLRRSVVLDEA